MTDLETQLQATAAEALLEHEKRALRERVKYFMLAHPARAPLSARMAAAMRAWRPLGAVSFARLHPLALSLVLALTVGTGTSYAAEGALPGDTLYPVKIRVNESVQGALAVSDEAKVAWHATRVERRLAEAEALASRGRLTPAARAELENGLDTSAKDFDTAVLAMADAIGNPAVIAVAASDFSANLERREKTLARAALFASSSEEEAAPIIARVRTHAERAQRVREVAERFASDDSERAASLIPVEISSVRQARHTPDAASAEQSAPAALSAQATTSASVPLQKRPEPNGREERKTFREALREAQTSSDDEHAREGESD